MAACKPQQPEAAPDVAAVNVAPVRNLSPVEEEHEAPAAALQASLVAAEHQSPQQHQGDAENHVQDAARVADSPQVQASGAFVCSELDGSKFVQADELADGGVMSTSESDRAYGDIDADMGPALALQEDAQGGVAPGHEAGVGRLSDADDNQLLAHQADAVPQQVRVDPP